ncbi:MAG TPA: hypothetical protein P5052_00415 [Candidatus Paceibacterota bacterium]|jgi:hypothetical protein|nr:hypothetical protein [Candidatus Paceibacterota bacterium]HRZ29269.1 hypothetical protein [Candidatus Paceibacterota bacterium]
MFIKETIPTLFHMPFPPMIGQKITKMFTHAEKVNANLDNKEDTLILFADPSAFKSEIYLTVKSPIDNENNVTISGTFMSKVFDGGYNDVPKHIKQMDQYLNTINKKAKKYYIHYAYCPKCAKKFGHNYMIFFAEI